MLDISFCVSPPPIMLFKKPQFQRLFGHNLFEITSLCLQDFDLIGIGLAGDIIRQMFLACVKEVLRPL